MKTTTKEIAELAGLFAADGSMQKGHISFWGNIREDREYYDNVIRPLFKKAFDIEVRPHEKASNSVYGFYVCKKRVIKFFNEDLGFPYGKKTYTVRVPKRILRSSDLEILSSFLRGFSDGDGNLNFGKKYGKCQKILKIINTYPRIHLTSVSVPLIDDLSFLLSQLDINHTISKIRARKSNESDSRRIEIRGKPRVKKWMEIVGFSNPVQTTRYEIFKKHDFVPVYTTLIQRKAILRGEIDPWSFYPSWVRSLAWIGHKKTV